MRAYVRGDVHISAFVHALVSDVLRKQGESVLEEIEFRGCSPGVKGIVQTVVQYSLDTIDDDTTSSARRTQSRANSSNAESDGMALLPEFHSVGLTMPIISGEFHVVCGAA